VLVDFACQSHRAAKRARGIVDANVNGVNEVCQRDDMNLLYGFGIPIDN